MAKSNAERQQELLDQRHRIADGPQALSEWAEKFGKVCDAKDVEDGTLSRTNQRSP
jgi:hypothetical protein